MLRNAVKRLKSRKTNSWRHNRLDHLAREEESRFLKKEKNEPIEKLDWLRVARVNDVAAKIVELESSTSEREKLKTLKCILLGEERLHPEFDTWRFEFLVLVKLNNKY